MYVHVNVKFEPLCAFGARTVWGNSWLPPDADSYTRKGVGEAGRAVVAEYDLIAF